MSKDVTQNETRAEAVQTQDTLLGMPRALVWGFLAVIIFMMGDGLESGWLSPYIVSLGFTQQQAGLVFTVYGIALAIASWFSGALAGIWGPRRTMLTGLLIWVVFEVGFILLGISVRNYPLMLLLYGLRGFGYPLFAYGFLVWIAYITPENKLGTAVGWFWFVFTGGLLVLGSYYSSFVIPRIGQIATLWTALIWVVIGGVLGIALIRGGADRNTDQQVTGSRNPIESLLHDAAIVVNNPQIAIGGVVRIINTTPQFGFLVFLPIYFTSRAVGFTLTQWLQLLGGMFLSNVIWNLLWGVLGDRLGWRNTIMWFGGVGCAVFILLVYFVPTTLGNNYYLTLLVMVLYGATLAAYVPLSALMPSMAPENKGGAMAILNLGAGLPTFIGPALVTLLLGVWGAGGLMILFAVLHLVGAVLTSFLRLPARQQQQQNVVAQ